MLIHFTFSRSVRLLSIFTLLLCGCSKDDPKPEPGPEPAPEKNRTVLFYMMDDHNLWDAMEKTLNELEAGWDEQTDGNLLVYLDPSPKLTQFPTPVLLKISHDETDAIRSEVVKAYPEQDPADNEVMRGVLEDAIALYPAGSHGLIIGTHGSAWFPDNTGSLVNDPDVGHDDDDEHALLSGGPTKSLGGGERYGTALEVDDLARLLPVKYDFIMFHACLMGNVEVAWELREKCNLMVGCMEPLPGWGFPYEEITEYLFTKPQPDFYHVVRSSVEWYDALSDEEFMNFDVSVIRTDKLDALAAAAKTIVDKLAADPRSYFARLAADGQCIDEDLPLRDLNQCIALGCAGNPDLEADYRAFAKALQDAIPQQGISFRDEDPDLTPHDDYCGLSCYIPLWAPNFAPLNDYYKTHYGWAGAAGFDKLILTE